MKNSKSSKDVDGSDKPSNNKNGFSLPKSVGIIYSDAKRKYFATKSAYITEKDAYNEAKITGSYLKKIGIKAMYFKGNTRLPEYLKKRKPEVVLNLVGSVKGQDYLASTIPAILELLEIPYTGAGILGESLSYNKFLVKKLLEQNGVPVPRYQLFYAASDYLDPTLRFPLISKLNEMHGAVEITKDAVSENEKHLRDRLKHLIKTYDQSILVEEFIVGREVTGILLEGLNKKV
jgi:D-alanine-D-alanine ligase